jgi:hypothetical protein
MRQSGASSPSFDQFQGTLVWMIFRAALIVVIVFIVWVWLRQRQK